MVTLHHTHPTLHHTHPTLPTYLNNAFSLQVYYQNSLSLQTSSDTCRKMEHFCTWWVIPVDDRSKCWSDGSSPRAICRRGIASSLSLFPERLMKVRFTWDWRAWSKGVESRERRLRLDKSSFWGSGSLSKTSNTFWRESMKNDKKQWHNNKQQTANNK